MSDNQSGASRAAKTGAPSATPSVAARAAATARPLLLLFVLAGPLAWLDGVNVVARGLPARAALGVVLVGMGLGALLALLLAPTVTLLDRLAARLGRARALPQALLATVWLVATTQTSHAAHPRLHVAA